MTLASSTAKSGPYACNGVTVAFAIGFACFAATDLYVVRTDTDGLDTYLTYVTDYSVALNADQTNSPGGTVTLAAAPATGFKVTILRNVGLTQGTSLPNQGGWYPKVVEAAFDRLTMMVQQLRERVDRSLQVGVTDANPTVLTSLATAAALNSEIAARVAASAALAATGGSTLVGAIASGSGAVARTAQDKHREFLTAFDFMTTAQVASVQAGAYSLNVGTALQAAIDAAYAAKLPLQLLGGGYLSNTLTVYPGQVIIGAGSRITTLKLANGANGDLLVAQNAYALFGTNSALGTNGLFLSGVTLDCNWLNQAPADIDACNGLAYYGAKPTFQDLVIKNVKGHGIRSEWYQFGEDVGGIEGCTSNVTIDTTGRNGWWDKGPHDHHAESIIVIDAGQEADNTYYGILTEGNGNGRFFNAHVWHRAAATNRVKFGISSGGGNEFIACHLEGGRGQIEHRGKGDRVIGCHFYAHAGAANSALAVFANNENIHSACRYVGTTGQAAYAIEFKSAASGNRVDGYFGNFDARSPFNFSSDGGLNTIVGQGYCAAGGATAFGGTMAADTSVDYAQGGTNIFSSPNYPAAATRGIKIGGVTAFLVDSSLRWLKKAVSAVTFGTTVPGVQIHGSDNNDSNLGIANWANDTTTPIIRTLKSRGATVGAHGLVQSGDTVMNLDGFASDGSAFNRVARIRFVIDAATGVGDTAGRIEFLTAPDGSNADVEALRIDNTGALIHRSNNTTVVDANSHIGLRSYTVGTLPSAATAMRVIYVSNGTTNKRMAVSDGTNWRWPDGAIVS